LRLYLGDHRDRGFLGLLLGEVVPEQGAVALSLPTNIQIERRASFGLSGGDLVRHVTVLPISGVAMVNASYLNVHDPRTAFSMVLNLLRFCD
jgi:hypothetical protein